MYKIAEATFQNSFIAPSLRADGCMVQKLSDTVGLGIPDLLIGTKTRGGAWVEVKTVHYPAKPTTKMNIHWRSGQKRWLKHWNHQPLPTFVLIGFSAGAFTKANYRWIVCPGHCLFYLELLTNIEMMKVSHQGEITFNKLLHAADLFERQLDTRGETRL